MSRENRARPVNNPLRSLVLRQQRRYSCQLASPVADETKGIAKENDQYLVTPRRGQYRILIPPRRNSVPFVPAAKAIALHGVAKKREEKRKEGQKENGEEKKEGRKEGKRRAGDGCIHRTMNLPGLLGACTCPLSNASQVARIQGIAAERELGSVPSVSFADPPPISNIS